MKQTRIGIIGCGVISNAYLNNISKYFHKLKVVACADLFPEKAKDTAARYQIPEVCSAEEILAAKDIDIILNLTIPASHYEVNKRALSAGKHVYCEKPLALKTEEVEELQALAAEKGLLIGCAPDTFLGSALQTCRKLIDDGWIGKPVAATANMISHGTETWHPSPDFYYKKGAGPMMDMGPYYITALVSLLGPVVSTGCFTSKAFEERMIYSKPRQGEKIKVEVPTQYSGIMRFEQGTVANINMSFDIWLSNLPKLEIYGTEGTLVVPDPNHFSGDVKVIRSESLIDEIDGLENSEAMGKLSRPEMWNKFKSIPHVFRQPDSNMRGLGLADMASAIEHGRIPRANGELAAHVTEVLLSFDPDGDEGIRHIRSTCTRPVPMRAGALVGDFE